ncbi:endo-beta-N-acetylglucosaminidase [Paraglaciecola chathamensis]|uniref:Mannosyl-glycoprotein endo-beta-N-acetylglucosaminidase n=1 Tax=Paraglaciecola chathamensis S18K6 TaxID=1127672 RepID=A0AAV3V5G3_9ALTE|nr:endo-beta-N-acetylglucosaminidase [Paraglaciecola chathamensis]GAC11800.1 mannosyl-glycoprotein endo-beta-N-acetylglucosaminidase [Paraglaciecola chathamensis S18K6]
MLKTLCSILLCSTFFCHAQSNDIRANQGPFALTLEQALNWTARSEFSSTQNISTEPLARRHAAQLDSSRANLDTRVKVLYAPDGMNNFANYLDTQATFNLYNFTHWSQIDVLNWFAGTADHVVQIPARPWVDTAHRNGVKVIGSIFLAIAKYGGSADTAEALLKQDAQGRFIMAHRLVDIAQYYGFDGWLMNQETNLTAIKDAENELVEGQKDARRGAKLGQKMLAFMQYLTAIAPQGMEIHWYDSMLENGEVRWQNQLNEKNQAFLHQGVSSADAMFMNYWWNKPMVERSVSLAQELGRSGYDLYFGADLWPSRNAQRAFSKTQWLEDLFDSDTKQGLTSIALFAPNFNFNFSGEPHTPVFSKFKDDPQDSLRFYQTEQRLFVGDDLNLANNDLDGWPGIGRYVPAKTTVNALPFETHFNTGQGKKLIENGQQVLSGWTDMSKQDLLPTWQFAVYGNQSMTVAYDFEEVFSGGSSLVFTGSLSTQKTRIPLYQTHFVLGKKNTATLTLKGDVSALSLYVETADAKRHMFALNAITPNDTQQGWHTYEVSLSTLAKEPIGQLGMLFREGTAEENVNVYLGQLAIR